MKRLLVTAVVALFAGPVFATNWEYLPNAGGQAIVYVDTDSIRSMGDIAQAWSKVIQKHNLPGSAAKTVALTAYSCSAKSLATMSFTEYNDDGDVLRSGKVDAPSFNDATPDTLGYALTAFVCARRK